MSKPDWKDAPEWAQYLAQDGHGAWYWYRDLPKPPGDKGVCWFCESGDFLAAHITGWRESLDSRDEAVVRANNPAKPAQLMTREQFRLIVDATLLAKTMQENSIVSDRFMKAGKRFDEIERLLCGD